MVGKITRMYKTKGEETTKIIVTIASIVSSRIEDKEKQAQLLLQDSMCAQCNTHISLEEESKLVSQEGLFVICKSCSGGR